MNCPNCGFSASDDSKFCQNCGTVLPTGVQRNEPPHTAESSGPQAVSLDAAQHAHKRKKARQCKACGADIDPHTRKCTVCGKPAHRISGAIIAFAAVSVLFVASLVVNTLQHLSLQSLTEQHQQQLERSDAMIFTQGSTISGLEDQLKESETERQHSEELLRDTQTELNQAQKEAEYFDLIRSFLSSSDAGYASDQFFTDKSVLILKQTDKWRPLTLTTGFSSAQYSLSVDGGSHYVTAYFSENTWSGTSTTIRVEPQRTGATYITFSNNLNSQTFRVLVIVTE